MKQSTAFLRSGMVRVLLRLGAIILGLAVLLSLLVFALDRPQTDAAEAPQITLSQTSATAPLQTTPPQTTAPPRSVCVTVRVDGTELQIESSAKAVGTLLAEAGIMLNPNDTVLPLRISDVHDGMVITVVRVTTEEFTASTELPFATQTQESADLYLGETQVLTEGKNGLRQLTFVKTLHDGVVAEVQLADSQVIEAPIDRVLLVGTKPRPVTTTRPPQTTKPQTQKPQTTKPKTTAQKPATVVSEPEALTVSVGGTVYTVSKVINGEAVAYYSKLTNPSTATGNPAIPGKTIAVDPSVIPLGSLVYITSVDGVSWSYGPAYAHDVGGGIKGNIVDLFKASYAECVAHGRRNCIIYIIEP